MSCFVDNTDGLIDDKVVKRKNVLKPSMYAMCRLFIGTVLQIKQKEKKHKPKKCSFCYRSGIGLIGSVIGGEKVRKVSSFSHCRYF